MSEIVLEDKRIFSHVTQINPVAVSSYDKEGDANI